jgi:glycosyltransferase involved in cell wall biosynthesis
LRFNIQKGTALKIIQIATSTEGGAGIAARRLNSALNDLGLDSTLISGSKTKHKSLKNEVVHRKTPTLRNLSRISTLFQQKFIQNQNLLVTPWSLRTLPVGKILNFNPQIVHIHSFYNLLDTKAIAALIKSGVRVFLTLHDERFYTGGCHHALECNNFQNQCVNCPESRRPFHKIVAHSHESLVHILGNETGPTVIAPSNWIAERAKRSRVLGNSKIIVINNPLSQEFILRSHHQRRRKSIDESYVVTFVAQDLFSPYKGLKTLIECINKFEDNFVSEKVDFIFVGKGEDLSFKKIHFEQYSKVDSNSMSEIYKKSDLLIVPSMADNSPNVIFEALVSGIPFVGSNRGGIAEISEAFKLPTFSYGDPDSIYRAIIKQKQKEVDHNAIRASALELVHPINVAQKLADIYQTK